ncbi:hypothetical protein T484DRAFT_1890394 [Baffinella frigidus]|nr:hypothetical protein T484DRAFT_1890394 [Cryptophyta sp. CCMP2293]|mmetsp:Transcript_65746/g.155761  ORF Transcript_65746/g.155761 Transcript_65746/m.155761 type:complete len:293 (-) Transcript_65746:27-905(-)
MADKEAEAATAPVENGNNAAAVPPADADSDDDVLLSTKVKKEPVVENGSGKKSPKAAAAPADDDSDEDAPLASKVKVKAKEASPKVKKEPAAAAPAPQKRPADDSDSEDDKPLSLKVVTKPSPAKKKVKKEKPPVSESSSDSSSEEEEEAKSRSKTKKPSASKGRRSIGGGGVANVKEWLIQRFLVRWWYVIEWPPKDREVEDVPEGFVEMEHYPYLYWNPLSGQVMNMRTKENMPPCKDMLMGKDKSEIKEMVVQAIEAQMEELKMAEPENTGLLKKLQDELKEVHHRKAL